MSLTLEQLFIDYMYENLGPREVEKLMAIRPGEIMLRNTMDQDLFEHPHVELWHRFLINYIPYRPAQYALILPCTRVKPYRLSATHLLAEKRLRAHGLESLVDVYIMSEPMVLVPRCLDIYYPFANYDYSPRELDEYHRMKFVSILKKVIPNLARAYRLIVSVLPRHHAGILREALSSTTEARNKFIVIDYAPLPFKSIARAVELIANCR